MMLESHVAPESEAQLAGPLVLHPRAELGRLEQEWGQ